MGGGFIGGGMKDVERMKECRRDEVFGGGKDMELCGGKGG